MNKMINLDFELEPVGGPYYGDVFWPASQEEIVSIEQTVGWQLPEEYVSFVCAIGLSTPVIPQRVRVDGGATYIPFDIFYGAPDRPTYSIVARCGSYLEPLSWLVFADGDLGQFYLDRDGLVYFEYREGSWFKVADSFAEFISLFEIDPELL